MPSKFPTLHNRQMAVHLLNRVAFGPRPGDVDALMQRGAADWVDEALSPPAADLALDRRLAPYISLRRSALDNWKSIKQRPDPVLRDDLYSGKILRAVYASNQLREVLTDFWYNHFNVMARERYLLIASYERDAIRPHILGRFRNLLGATATHPAMLTYLDNTSNVANRYDRGVLVEGVNENYGRELMELHTVSVHGGYQQSDVTEAARALTGWQADCFSAEATFEYRYNAEKHDRGAKRVMSLRLPPDGGESDGVRLLDYLASHPKTAHFISWRLAQRFVADDPPVSLVDRMASTFNRTRGNLGDVLLTLLRSDEFWSDGAIGVKTKSPFQFVASALRAVDAEVHDPQEITHGALQRMGMLPYECSPPTGYSNRGSDWLSTSDQVQRFDFALRLATNTLPGVTASIDGLTGGSDDIDEIARSTYERQLGRTPAPATVGVLRSTRTDGPPKRNKVVALILASADFQRS